MYVYIVPYLFKVGSGLMGEKNIAGASGKFEHSQLWPGFTLVRLLGGLR